MGAECTSTQLDAIRHGARAWMTHQSQVHGWWHVTEKGRNKKFKKISKRNLPYVGMAGWMDALDALADKVQTRRAHSTTLLHFTQPSLHK